ncbi:hypothetical protein N474_20430 [Pseudoalteromonas luteoviolacea CPMOR-2]|uniref:Lipoprotein n=1 Tax=Pseudoalteromonas luteoviolacea DSM 6061 TaxID=1365250 RepID=A0A166YYD7_9GAMM|nr:hypothetical protein [Pseudoalteromonas luteoviolacea]KZN43631.1 hypothetical protein N475_08660 [Pseudoalteromonas luteoviolacea DSM 6061]KZN53702.1 hypothetical protein N474_20430 [Pseudoalteromonas luteoviolacea CPMOR-2]MBE0386485.1 hypothetical protein [Pseudoalteromonas luteoviolacea DSM 6061]
MNKVIAIIITLLLTACGGGSGGSDGQSQTPSSTTNTTTTTTQSTTNTDTQAQTTTEEQAAEEQITEETNSEEGMEAVVVDESFDFQTDVPVSVSIGPDVVSSRAFINICQQDATLTNEDTCFLRAPIDSNGLTVQILLPHSEQKLKAEIWYYSTSIEPLVYNWEFDATVQQQEWKIN